ncbi:PCMD domain-containing protein [Bacteroides stercoris]|uniref:PCMD domain-containing protein n=1 Tax=Bacteroides stercoris TaxID=46506 RepID=UPI00216B2677
MGMILRIASSRIVGQGDIVGRSGYFSLNLSANSVMRGRLDARRTLKSLVADLRVYTYTRDNGTAYAGYLFTGTFDKNTDTYTLGIQHESRPTSISFDYKYSPVINDKCLAYAKVYNADKKEIASTIEFNSSEQEEYTAQTLKFEYNKEHMQSKAKYITVFFQSGYDTTISNMHRENGDYGSSPFGEDRVVGSVLKIDNVVLNYDYE